MKSGADMYSVAIPLQGKHTEEESQPEDEQDSNQQGQ
jgi:hypothetical protein